MLRLPDPFAHLPRYPLLYPSASPIHPLQTLSSLLNSNSNSNQNTPPNPEKRQPRISISLYTKREDHSSPLACAGNKYRKLEYIIPDILSKTSAKPDPPTTIVTEGAIQSNHTIQVAAVAKKLGLEAVVLLHKGVGGGLAAAAAGGNEGVFLQGGNVQVARLLGADVRVLEPRARSPEQRARDAERDPSERVEGVLEGLRGEVKSPYWISSGASLHPLGGLGYARCAFEIAGQEGEVLCSSGSGGGRFDYVFVACGSGSTIGGLIAGFKLLEKIEGGGGGGRRRPRQVIGIVISPTKPKAWHEERVLRFARQAGGMIGLDPEKDITMDDVRLDDRFVGTAYGVLDTETKKVLRMMAEKEQVILDPVYTAKVVRGMTHWVVEGEIARDVTAAQSDPVDEVNALFIHTGGQSALGAYPDV